MSVGAEPREVALLPGFMQRAEAWKPVAEGLPERYRSVPVDLTARGLDALVGEIERRVAPGAALVGYSMGGRLALHLALRRPGRFGAVAVVGASPGIEDPEARRARREADERLADWIEGHSIDDVVARWEGQPIFASQPPALVAAQRPGRLSHDPAELAALLRSAGQGALPPLWGELARLDLPVLALAGELDRRYGDAAARMAAALPRGFHRLIPGTGHAPQLEAPRVVARVLGEFLDEHLG